MRLISLFYCLISNAFLLIISNNSLAQELKLTTPLQSQCNNEAIRIWDNITNYYYGVAGSGFIGHDEYIGSCQAKFQWGGPWAPVDGYKHTLCGSFILKKSHGLITTYINHEKYHFVSEGDGDMVFYVKPDSSFQNLLKNSLRPSGHYFKDSTIACEVGIKKEGSTIESNVSRYIKSLNLDSLQYKSVGVYGAWVSDVRKQNSPEIHPVQQMWMTQFHDNSAEYYLYTLLDNSSRFSNKDDFSDTCFSKAWISVPLVNTFYIPFEVSLKTDKSIQYDFTMPSYSNINSYSGQEQNISLVINGKLRLEVKRSDNSFSKITFYDICQTDNDTVHGYLRIETSIGKFDLKSGAHVVIKIIRSERMNNK